MIRPQPNESEFANIGLLGLGDAHYAIGASIFEEFAQRPHFVKNGAAEWNANHSQAHASDAVEPPSSIFRQCSSYCVHAAKRDLELDPEAMQKTRGLLLMINHHMKDLYASIKKQIDASARHPLLFVRVVLPAETVQWRAWILTRAVFKPRSIDGVPVYSTKDDTNADSLNVPFVVHLDTKQVDQSDTTVPHFVCMDEIMVEMTMFCQLYPEATLQYCYNPDYTQSCHRPLTELIVKGPLRWVPVDSSTCEFDSDDDDSDVELVEIDDMLGDLMSM